MTRALLALLGLVLCACIDHGVVGMRDAASEPNPACVDDDDDEPFDDEPFDDDDDCELDEVDGGDGDGDDLNDLE
jgi:hypothetical protein